MAFREIVEGLKSPPGATDRFKRLDAFDRVLLGTVYEDLSLAFETEEDARGDYVRMRERRPSVRYNMSLMVTRRSQAELWGDEQLPAWQCVTDRDGNRDKKREQLLEFVTSETSLELVMAEAYEIGQSGSVAIVVRRRDDGMPDFDIIEGKYGTPVFDPKNLQRLVLFANIYPVLGQALLEAMSVAERTANEMLADADEKKIRESETYWFRIEFDDREERRFDPLSSSDYHNLGKQRKDGTLIQWIERSKSTHRFGCVPVVWIRNLVGRRRDIDGPCTFSCLLDNNVELDYTLSQAGRGLKYNGDPMLFIRRGELDFSNRRPAGDLSEMAIKDGSGRLARTGATTLSEGPGGDAKLLEIAGSGIKEQREFAKQLREWSLELIGANKADAENERGATSGRALEKLDRAMRLLIKFQRKAYGDLGMVPLMRVVLSGLKSTYLTIDAVDAAECDPTARMRQVWPKEDIADGQDMLFRAQALQTYAGAPLTAPVPLVELPSLQQRAANDLGFSDPNSVTRSLDKEVPSPTDAADAAKESNASPKIP